MSASFDTDQLRILAWEPLDGGRRSPDLVGGKAAALDRLVGAGMPVPRAAVITADAYRAAVRSAGLEDMLLTLPANVDPDDFEADAARIDRAFREAPLPDDVVAAINGACQWVAASGPVAVRSSATAEDRTGASFAGQYRSLLDVGPDDVEDAVRMCWASLWSPSARAYRRAEGIDEADLAMAVIVQEMIESEHSGVIFTVDPTNPGSDDLRVEVVDGLGERLVSGEVTPDVFHVRRADVGVVENSAPAFITEVAERALAIERVFGAPQDIEWAIAGGRSYVVQARPITAGMASTHDSFDTPAVDGVMYSPVGVAEMLPGVLPPLLWTINGPMIESAFHALFTSLGVSSAVNDQRMVSRFRGRATLNLTMLKAAAKRMPGGSAADVEQQYLDRVVTHEPEAKPGVGARAARARTGFKAMRLRRESTVECEAFLAAVAQITALEPDVEQRSTETLVEYRHRVRDVARAGLCAEVAVSAAATADYRTLEIELGRLLGDGEASLTAQRLTAGLLGSDAPALSVVDAVWDAHQDIKEREVIARAVHDGPLEETDARLRALGPVGEQFLNECVQRLKKIGSRAVYGGETWAQSHSEVWAALRRTAELDPDTDAQSKKLGSAGTAAQQFFQELDDRLRRTRWSTRILTGQLIDLRRRFLRRTLTDTITFLRLREEVKAGALSLGGEERRVIDELARRLVGAGRLEREADVEILHDDELDRLALGQRGPTVHDLAVRRVALRAANDAAALPDVFTGAPPNDLPEAVEAADDGHVLYGWATSPGRVVGQARVIRERSDAHNLRHDEILVGRSTDPSWTPLFLTAGGIVMEEGGPLSHAAIVAREFGLPAVLNVKEATRRITTGMMLAVDGTAGTVEIVDSKRSEEAA